MTIQWLSRGELMPSAMQYIEKTDVVLDVGAGIRNVEYAQGKLQILCEPFGEYIRVLQEKYSNDLQVMIIQNKGIEFLSAAPDFAVDTILLVDVIEHFEKAEGIQLLRECVRVARQQIAVFTPLGFMSQDYQEGDIDGWGLTGGFWQRHLSGWVPEDFDASWDILACRDFHMINGKGETFDPPFGAFWAIKKVKVVKPASDHLLGALLENYARQVDDYVALKKHNTALEEQHLALEGRYTALEQQHLALEGRYTALEQQHLALEGRYTALEQRLSTLAQQITPLEDQIALLNGFTDNIRSSWIVRLFHKP